MKLFLSRPESIVRVLRISVVVLVSPMLSAQSTVTEGAVTFPQDNISDLRGVLNAFLAFRRACLDQPVTKDLPDVLLPDGYRIVSSTDHLFGTESNAETGRWILSKTGSEEDDFAGGHPIIDLKIPTEGARDGECGVIWSKAWDYPPPVDRIVASTASVFDAWLSYGLKAIRVSRPDSGFVVADRYVATSEWAAQCWTTDRCHIEVLITMTPDAGINLAIRRD